MTQPNQEKVALLGHCARQAYLLLPDAPAIERTVVLVLAVVDEAAAAVVLDTETPQFEAVVRDVFDAEHVEHVLSYKDREAGGLLRVVAGLPEGILRFRTSILPGASS